MQTVDTLIINAAQVVTCAGGGQPKRGADMREAGIIDGGAVAITGGQIVAVGTTDDIRAGYQAEQVIDADGCAVMPGLVDPHTHAVFAGSRLDEFERRIAGATYMEILAEGGGILSTMRATRAGTPDALTASASRRLRRMLACGTTTAEIKTGYGLDIASEIKMLNSIAEVAERLPLNIVPTFMGAHAIPPEQPDMKAYAAHVINDMLPAIHDAYRQTALAARGVRLAADVFCEDGVFDVAASRHILRAARDQWRMPVKAHVDEFVNLGGAVMAVELGALSVDHLDVTPQDELAFLAKSETVGVMLPAVNFNLGNDHYGDARFLIDSGGIMALSTDYNPGSAPTLSQPMVMALACRYQRLLPAEALNACTINAAAALGMADRVGSLEAGKQADIVILDADDYRAMIYEFGDSIVKQVIIKGETAWPTASS